MVDWTQREAGKLSRSRRSIPHGLQCSHAAFERALTRLNVSRETKRWLPV